MPAEWLQIHPINPQKRALNHAAVTAASALGLEIWGHSA